MPQWIFFFFFFCNSTYSLYPEHWIIQEPVFVLHLFTCHGRIMPHLAELLLMHSITLDMCMQLFEISYMDSPWKNSWHIFLFWTGLCPFPKLLPFEKYGYSLVSKISKKLFKLEPWNLINRLVVIRRPDKILNKFWKILHELWPFVILGIFTLSAK